MSEEERQIPMPPTTRDELLFGALRTVNITSMMINDVREELYNLLGDDADNPKYDRIHAILRRQFSDCSGVHLFIAASNLRIDLPDDLREEPRDDDYDED